MKRRIKVSSFELYKFDSFSPHSRSIPRELMHSYLGVACKLLQFAATQQAGMVRAFCRPHAYTFNEQSKMATALTPLTNVTSEKSHVTDGDPETVVSASLQKVKSIKNVLKHFFFLFFLSLNLKLVTHSPVISIVILRT